MSAKTSYPKHKFQVELGLNALSPQKWTSWYNSRKPMVLSEGIQR